MNLLWLGIALLLLPALWLVLLPLRRAGHVRDEIQAFESRELNDADNVAVYRQRLAALEAALADGQIDQARFDEDRLELDRSLLEDTEAARRKPLKPARAGRVLVPLLLLVLAIGSLYAYQRLGAEGDLALYAAQQEVIQSPQGSLKMLIARFEQEAERQPDNPKVWLALFPLYRDTGALGKAGEALEHLIALEGRHAELLAQLAQVRFFDARRTLTDDVKALVDEALAKDPRQPTVLSMLGIEAFDHGRYEQAIDYWRRAVAGFEDEGAASALREGIAEAQTRLGIAPRSAEGEGEQAVTDARVRVHVSLAESLRDQVPDDATVFIVARDVEGKLPPLAITQVPVSELPLEVTLDDDDAMAPMARLSQVEQVRLVARVSASGQATPRPGDLYGEHAPVAVGAGGDAPVDVKIDRIYE
ncbi:c-type cytochrome biogenesis protein CcmI [Halomonas shantousis]